MFDRLPTSASDFYQRILGTTLFAVKGKRLYG